MRNYLKLIIIATIGILSACKPGPVTLGHHPTAVQDSKGQTRYVDYTVDKKRQVSVQRATGSDLVTEKISAAFAQDPLLKPYNIQVSTHRGEVILAGHVPSREIRNYAIRTARYAKGVLAVNAKNLVVTGQQQ